MDLIHRPVLPQPQSPHQQDHIQSIGHARERQRVRLHTAVRPPMPLTLRIWTAIACMDQSDHSLQRDHRSPRQRHGLSQGSLAYRALMLTWSIPASTQLGIRSAPFHGRPPCLSRTALLVSPFLFYLMSPNASFALTVLKAEGEGPCSRFAMEEQTVPQETGLGGASQI